LDDYSEWGGHASDHPIPFWDVVSKKKDISIKAKIVDEIIQLCEKYNEYTRVLREPSTGESQLDILKFLDQKGVRYGKVVMRETDYKTIKGMLHGMFYDRVPNRKTKPENEDDSLPE